MRKCTVAFHQITKIHLLLRCVSMKRYTVEMNCMIYGGVASRNLLCTVYMCVYALEWLNAVHCRCCCRCCCYALGVILYNGIICQQVGNSRSITICMCKFVVFIYVPVNKSLFMCIKNLN